MYLYRPIKESLRSPYIGRYTPYGIEIVQLTDNDTQKVQLVSDVSLDLAVVSHISYLCNKGQLEPIHIGDILEDLLP